MHDSVPPKLVRPFKRLHDIRLSPSVELALPWLSLCALWVLFEAPTVLSSGGVSLKHVRPSADILVLVTLAALSRNWPWPRAVRGLLLAYATLLVVIRLDYVIFMLLMRDEPLLYDQWLMVRHLAVLISDLWSPMVAFASVAIVTCVVALPWLVRRLLSRASTLLEAARISTTRRVAMIVWAGVLLATAVHALGLSATPIVAWVSPVFFDNLRRSERAYAAMKRGLQKPAYTELLTLELPDDKRPDVYLLLIESYGRLMFSDPQLGPEHARRLSEMQARTRAAGWTEVSAYSASSVSGGRSWMAEASILLGTPVTYEALYQHLMLHAERLPNMVSFLRAQSYDTILMAGSDRDRPGVKTVNPYGYQHYVNYEMLGYRGKAFGWGIVPDQYSLGFVESKFLARRTRPIFLNAHFVSSHAPWKDIPVLVEDYTSLNPAQGRTEIVEHAGPKIVLRSLRRFKREDAQTNWYMGNLNETLRLGYERAIDYELSVIQDFLCRQTQEALVIVMGDHQPPVIPDDQAAFDVPVHVFARNPALLTEFRAAGYVTGLTPAQTVSSHAGLLSLLARSLARAAALPTDLPAFRPEGVRLMGE